MVIAFFGTSNYCLPLLDSLKDNFDLQLVVTRSDKPEGRKQIITPSQVKLWALQHNISVITPETLKKETNDRVNLIKLLTEKKCDMAIVADYGLIIPEGVFNIPKLGTFNIHFSKLPDLRGPSPVQFTLLRSDDKAWVTIFKLESPPELKIKMDSGPILWQKEFPIDQADTTQSLYSKLFQEVAQTLPHILSTYSQQPTTNNQSPTTKHQQLLTPQLHKNTTYCRFLTKDDGFIECNIIQKAMRGEQLEVSDLPKIQQEALTTDNFKFQIPNLKLIYSFFRAVTPWPGMWTNVKLQRMKILKCHLVSGKLVIDQVQFEGKNPISWTDIKSLSV